MKVFLGVCLVLILTGCASVTGSKIQPVSVQTFQDNKEVEGAVCTLTNDEGKWTVTTPGSVTVHKSTDDLLVFCNKEAVGNGRETIVSKANGGAWGNIILGGGIGYIADRQTGAGFNYPPIVNVILDRIAAAVGTETANPKSATQAEIAKPVTKEIAVAN